jgi:hypothetical protein
VRGDPIARGLALDTLAAPTALAGRMLLVAVWDRQAARVR